MTRVAVLGAGVAGLTAAQELAERGFQVVLYDAGDIPGGKSRSMPAVGTGGSSRRDLPGEHGFRFFPGFYRHIPDTMQRIPYRDQPLGVLNNLIETSRTLAVTTSRGGFSVPSRATGSFSDLSSLSDFLVQILMGNALGVPAFEIWHIVYQFLTVLTSCEERRFAEFEYIPWWDFVGASQRSVEFQKYVVQGMVKNLVACRAQDISTRTGAVTFLQLVLDIATASSDRVLNGPTNDVWIDPWVTYLRSLGVELRSRAVVEAFTCTRDRIESIRIREGSAVQEVQADFYVAALPIEVLRRLVTPAMIEAEPRMQGLHKLVTEWMVGIQFYLDRDVPIVPGHVILLDSPWSLTSITQSRFWTGVNLADFGDGNVKSILSLDISDWNTPGVLYGKTAKECTPEEIKTEAWAQFCAHFSADRRDLDAVEILDWFLDPAVVWTPTGIQNREPLFINTAGSWDYRPEAITQIENLFLASDYVRTNTDFASMEAANEAARRAVNGLLDAAGSPARRCSIFTLEEPALFGPLRAYDRARFQLGLPHQMPALRGWFEGLLKRGLGSYDSSEGTPIEQLSRMQLGELVSTVDWNWRSVQAWLRQGWRPRESVKGPSPALARSRPGRRDATGSLAQLEKLSAKYDLAALEQELRSLREMVERGISPLNELLQQKGRLAPHAPALGEVVDQILAAPSKRIRALCVYLSASVGRRTHAPAVANITLAVELVHSGSLLHDDVIDVGMRRRGVRTARLLYGNAASVLGGDFLIVRAAQLLMEVSRPDLVADLFSVMEEMVSAECEQLSHRGTLPRDTEAYLRIIGGKTAGLFGWACRAGGATSNVGEEVLESLERYGRYLGLTFQLIDDILDLTGSPADVGKTLHADFAAGTVTYPLIVAAESDPQSAEELEDLLRAQRPLPGNLRTVTLRDERLRDILERTSAIPLTWARAREYVTHALAELRILPWSVARHALTRLAEASLDRRR